jgi:hypothetical protein
MLAKDVESHRDVRCQGSTFPRQSVHRWHSFLLAAQLVLGP